MAEGDADILNRGQPLPSQFMSGVADVLRVDRAAFAANGGVDRLTVAGGIALESGTADLTTLPLTLTWGDLSFVIPEGEFQRVGQTNVYRARWMSQGTLIVARFDWDQCVFRISIQSTDIHPKTGPVTFGVAFGSLDQVEEFSLP